MVVVIISTNTFTRKPDTNLDWVKWQDTHIDILFKYFQFDYQTYYTCEKICTCNGLTGVFLK